MSSETTYYAHITLNDEGLKKMPGLSLKLTPDQFESVLYKLEHLHKEVGYGAAKETIKQGEVTIEHKEGCLFLSLNHVKHIQFLRCGGTVVELVRQTGVVQDESLRTSAAVDALIQAGIKGAFEVNIKLGIPLLKDVDGKQIPVYEETHHVPATLTATPQPEHTSGFNCPCPGCL